MINPPLDFFSTKSKRVKVLSESYQFLRLCGRRSPTGNLTNGRLITIICRGGFRVYFHICREKNLPFIFSASSFSWARFPLIGSHSISSVIILSRSSRGFAEGTTNISPPLRLPEIRVDKTEFHIFWKVDIFLSKTIFCESPGWPDKSASEVLLRFFRDWLESLS